MMMWMMMSVHVGRRDRPVGGEGSLADAVGSRGGGGVMAVEAK
jgi:hypothetical protein